MSAALKELEGLVTSALKKVSLVREAEEEAPL